MTSPEPASGRETAVIGLGKSGRAVATLLARRGHRVYASDASNTEVVLENAGALRAAGVDTDSGGHDLGRIARAAEVVVSPGVPPESPPLDAARTARIPIVSEIEVALRYLPELRYVAVTGTNGKTTTTALVRHLLSALGADAVEAGNIGTPLADVALRPVPPSWVSLEVSSFQLHDTPGLNPTVGVVTNLSPDHLDRYDSVEKYYADKALIFANAHAGSRWVVNADDPELTRLMSKAAKQAGRLAGTTLRFSLRERDTEAWYDRVSDQLMVQGAPLLPRAQLQLFGDHNVANALAASLAVMAADPSYGGDDERRRIAHALTTFRALKHRLEPAGEFGGVQWINDSKATNVSSTLVAVQGMTKPTILLLGGRHKGEPYTALAEPLSRVGGRVLAYGEAGPLVQADLEGAVTVERLGSSFEEVIQRARDIAQPGDVVLLSPACSSFDMFRNYEERGAEFKRLAAKGGRG